MYGCKSWTIKKAECQRINAFELWCWRRLLRVPGLQGDQMTTLKGYKFHKLAVNLDRHLGRGTDAEAEVPILWPLTHWKRH